MTQLTTKQKKIESVRELLSRKSVKEQIAMAAPKHLTPDRITRIAMMSVQLEPKLLDCTPESLLGSVLSCTQLGLEPDGVGGRAHLIAYGNKCTLVIGYRGLMELARRSDEIQLLEARVVHDKDHFQYAYGAHPTLVHVPTMELDRGEIIAAYAVATMRNGAVQFEVMSRAEIDAIRAKAPAGKSGPWVTHYSEMARKTPMRRLCKYLPSSADLQRAVTLDEAAEQGLPQHIEPIDVEVVNVNDRPAAKPKTVADLVPEVVDAAATSMPETKDAEGDGDLVELENKKLRAVGLFQKLPAAKRAVVCDTLGFSGLDGIKKMNTVKDLQSVVDACMSA